MKAFFLPLRAFLFFTLLTGIAYPLFITGVAQVFFPEKANGSFLLKNGKACGSILIGQAFDTTIYFNSRPSAISYNPMPSGASNYCLTNRKLKKLADERIQSFITFNLLDQSTVVPSEMIFASGSGLDPHISFRSAFLQVERIADARHFNTNQKQKLIQCIHDQTEPPQFLCLGEERINVLLLNLALDEIK
jgi:potassium-transporting ATPase KdpC subunit